MLQMRLKLLAEVERLEYSLDLAGGKASTGAGVGSTVTLEKEGDGLGAGVGYTCESASHFFLLRVRSLWEEFLAKCILEKQNTQGFGKISSLMSLYSSHYFANLRSLGTKEIRFLALSFSSIFCKCSEANFFGLQRWRL